MLQVQQLNQFYGGNHILRNINFDVPASKLTMLFGRNGTSKTTLLKCLMGMVPAVSGTIDRKGCIIQKLPAYKRVSQGLVYMPQRCKVFPRLTVGEDLLIGAATKRAPPKVSDPIYELFPMLKEMKGRRGGGPSGGQQRQPAIGRTLMSKSRLLILNEPIEGI